MGRLKRKFRTGIPIVLLVGSAVVFVNFFSPLRHGHHQQEKLRNNFPRIHYPYLANGSGICDTHNTPMSTNSSPNLLLILVHSGVGHFFQRRVIRQTWASLKRIPGFRLRVAFLLGLPTDNRTQTDIEEENHQHGDIVQASFLDTYRNLTIKHLMGYRWTVSFCPSATYIVKADDDVFVDVFRVSAFLRQTFSSANSVLLCRVIHRGSKPRRKGKWKVTIREYPFDAYPPYCSGMGYVMSPDIVRSVLGAIDGKDFLWVDDVFVTGILAQKAGITQQPMNVRYTEDSKVVAKWLSSKSQTSSPFMFAEIETDASWPPTMKKLWDKTMKSWTHL